MKINRIYVKKYGPVQKDLELKNGINAVRGPNESGKSLLVEALQRKLADGSVPDPAVYDKPEGFVEVQGEGSKETLQDGDTLTEFFETVYGQELNPEELRNVFVIRKGDLTFHEADNFYSHITDRLTGRRVEDIDELTDELEAEGRLTPTNQLANNKDHNKAKNQRDTAESLKKEIEEYIQKAEKQQIDGAETELFEIKHRIEELEERKKELETARAISQKRSRYRELKKDKELIEQNLRELDGLPDREDLDRIKSRLEELTEIEGNREQLQERNESGLKMTKLSVGAGIISFALLAGLNLPLVGAVTPVGFLVASIYFWRQASNASEELAQLDRREKKVLSDARAAGIELDERNEVRERIRELKDRHEDLEDQNKRKAAVLERELGFNADGSEEIVEKSGEKLRELEQDIDDSVELEYSEKELEDVNSELKQAGKNKESLEDDLEQHRRKLRQFQDRAQDLDFRYFTDESLKLEINSLESLEKLKKRLEGFVRDIEHDAEASRKAISIFEEIQEEEKEETAELFEDGSRATEIFTEITEGRYSKVTYDSESNRLKVEKSTGETFEPELLSDGTKDQLYLSIRVALGEKLLEGDQGFFVMDDAFITSDASRIEKQAEVVEKLADEGWQIIYLSSKEDAISALSERTDNELKELSSLE